MKQTYSYLLFLSFTVICSVNGRNFHAERLHILKKDGFNPRIIYDIGAHKGSWTAEAKPFFGDAQFYLFEANDYYDAYLRRLGYPYFIALLGDCQKMMPFYSINGSGDSVLLEQTHHYQEGHYEQKLLPMTTLDNIVKQYDLPLPDFIKMDVQGAEKLIILGGSQTITHAEAILLEVATIEYNKNAPLVFEIMCLMDQFGYCMLDILELHYLPTQELIEIDILFVKKDSSLIKRGILC